MNRFRESPHKVYRLVGSGQIFGTVKVCRGLGRWSRFKRLEFDNGNEKTASEYATSSEL